ncbi:MAG: hypothetical protein HY314_11290 [Acidobacteria bacterium]|nr:hypothetical protein [Acidobacteriota bacterium]
MRKPHETTAQQFLDFFLVPAAGGFEAGERRGPGLAGDVGPADATSPEPATDADGENTCLTQYAEDFCRITGRRQSSPGNQVVGQIGGEHD